MHGHSGGRPPSPFAPAPPSVQALPLQEPEEPGWDLGYSLEELDPIASEVVPLVQHWADAGARDRRSLWEFRAAGRMPSLLWADLDAGSASSAHPSHEQAWDFEQRWRRLEAEQPAGPVAGTSSRGRGKRRPPGSRR